MAQYDGIVIHFGEIWLKGGNRNSFILMLYDNIKCSLRDEHYARLENARDRFFLETDKKSDLESIESKLSKVFGISWFAPAVVSESSLGSILKAANALLSKKDTVRIVPNRALKTLSFNSADVVTHFIKNSDKLNFKIDKDAKRDLYVSITKNRAFIYDRKIQGAKGLPVGSSGNAVVLFSGGIDSPVAAYYAMKRGLHPVYLHVHAFQNNDDEKLSKIRDLAKHLSAYSCGSVLYCVPGHVFQSSAMRIPRRYELVMFKLFMHRLAERIAKKERAECIVTGESLGQVASQTLSNLTTSQQGIKPLIMRPLIGFDKQEIINVASQIGTFEMSIIKYRDVCSIAAKNPAITTDYKEIRKYWKEASMDDAVSMTLKKAGRELI
ncbi:MAG: tRNA uracil 4-sulfurtransferase ThiI [Candidatus Micrarchaeaceae archaeon]|jgi:thiamine biosynthesis protein ThiI